MASCDPYSIDVILNTDIPYHKYIIEIISVLALTPGALPLLWIFCEGRK